MRHLALMWSLSVLWWDLIVITDQLCRHSTPIYTPSLIHDPWQLMSAFIYGMQQYRLKSVTFGTFLCVFVYRRTLSRCGPCASYQIWPLRRSPNMDFQSYFLHIFVQQTASEFWVLLHQIHVVTCGPRLITREIPNKWHLIYIRISFANRV